MLVVEGFNVKTGLGSRFGSYLLQAGFKGRYDHIGVHTEGSGGLWQQMGYQGLDPDGILKAIKELVEAAMPKLPSGMFYGDPRTFAE